MFHWQFIPLYPHSHIVCPSSLYPHFCIRVLHHSAPVRRRFRLDQVGHTSLEPGGSDSLRLYSQRSGLDRSLKHAMICSRLGRIISRGEAHNQGCGADTSGVCSPIGVRQLLEDAVTGSGLCPGLSNVVFVHEGTIWSDSYVDWCMIVYE